MCKLSSYFYPQHIPRPRISAIWRPPSERQSSAGTLYRCFSGTGLPWIVDNWQNQRNAFGTHSSLLRMVGSGWLAQDPLRTTSPAFEFALYKSVQVAILVVFHNKQVKNKTTVSSWGKSPWVFPSNAFVLKNPLSVTKWWQKMRKGKMPGWKELRS